MSDDFISELANATKYENGNLFKAGKGVAILKDVKIFKSTKDGGDPFTWVAEFLIKKSSKVDPNIEPNPVGTTASSIQKPTKSDYPKAAKSNILKVHLAILGPGSEGLSQEQLTEAIRQLLRPFPEGNPLKGRTNVAIPCPERGRQVGYETRANKKGVHYPEFFAIQQTEADLAENLKLLDAAD